MQGGPGVFRLRHSLAYTRPKEIAMPANGWGIVLGDELYQLRVERERGDRYRVGLCNASGQAIWQTRLSCWSLAGVRYHETAGGALLALVNHLKGTMGSSISVVGLRASWAEMVDWIRTTEREIAEDDKPYRPEPLAPPSKRLPGKIF